MAKPSTTIERAAKHCKPSAYLDYRLFLKAIYTQCKEDQANYSYQKFAVDLGFKATTVMHQIVNSHRPLTVKAAQQIVTCFGLEAREQKYFLLMVELANAKTASVRAEKFQIMQTLKRDTLPEELDRNLLDYFSHWHHPVIWELLGTAGCKADPEWIAKKIIPNLKVSVVEESLALLQKLDLIAFDNEAGLYRQTQNRVTTGHQIKGMALVSFHASLDVYKRQGFLQCRALPTEQFIAV